MTNWATNMDAMWDEPSLVSYMERLGSFSRCDLVRQAWQRRIRPGAARLSADHRGMGG